MPQIQMNLGKKQSKLPMKLGSSSVNTTSALKNNLKGRILTHISAERMQHPPGRSSPRVINPQSGPWHAPVVAISFIWVLCCVTYSQELPRLQPISLAECENRKPEACESRTAAMDGITQKTPPDEAIIVIARLGASETKRNLNRRRLENVRAYWTQAIALEARRKLETIIVAEGERTAGYGRLEFYVSGKLVWVMNVPRNADVDFGDCVPPDDSYIRNRVYDPCWIKSHRIFYPCRDRYPPRKH